LFFFNFFRLSRFVFAAPLGFPHRGKPRSKKMLARPALRRDTMAARIFNVLLKSNQANRQLVMVAIQNMPNHPQNWNKGNSTA